MGANLWQQILEKLPIKSEQNGKMRYATWFIMALIAVGIYFMYLSATPKRQVEITPREHVSQTQVPVTTFFTYKEQLERELQDRLESVRGVKAAKVFITLESGPIKEYLQNEEISQRTTEEKDGGGGTRLIEENSTRTETVMSHGNNGQQALVVREQTPRIAGVMVTVKGEGGAALLEEITRAVCAALNVPAHRVTVLAME